MLYPHHIWIPNFPTFEGIGNYNKPLTVFTQTGTSTRELARTVRKQFAKLSGGACSVSSQVRIFKYLYCWDAYSDLLGETRLRTCRVFVFLSLSVFLCLGLWRQIHKYDDFFLYVIQDVPWTYRTNLTSRTCSTFRPSQKCRTCPITKFYCLWMWMNEYENETTILKWTNP